MTNYSKAEVDARGRRRRSRRSNFLSIGEKGEPEPGEEIQPSKVHWIEVHVQTHPILVETQGLFPQSEQKSTTIPGQLNMFQTTNDRRRGRTRDRVRVGCGRHRH